MKNKIFVLFLLTALITSMPLLSKQNKANPSNYWPGKPWMCPDCHMITDPLCHDCDESDEGNDNNEDNIAQNKEKDE
ncbi:MAG: hypothetical protein A3F40_01865 [Chlamydiae bacterium RIFCSPHIGHO2_12_FULL_27_8]|nr:MAG: hypothetical protein A3F40_01865 [Chlamydiae bacterium RIFCSPHIGHO2_12_FULL_27_8]OGN65938.1 MAG: hypothetical protein A2888_02350 [Chlamydiae bacterium RIFCSPLOWO2_01_FULL_28_7]